MVTPLPVFVGIGGITCAGRVSGHLAYQRLLYQQSSAEQRRRVLLDLAVLQELLVYDNGQYLSDGEAVETDAWLRQHEQALLDSTLIRALEPGLLDGGNARCNTFMDVRPEQPLSFTLPVQQLPRRIPDHWRVETLPDKRARVTISGEQRLLVEDRMQLEMAGAGQFPTGFNPERFYNYRNHGRLLASTIFGASDAMHASGLDIDALIANLSPDQISVYYGSALGQNDENAAGGMYESRFLGRRTNSKHLPFSLQDMPGDFVAAYMLGTPARTGSVTGACATYLYNLQRGLDDIRSGRSRLVFVGGSECPLTVPIAQGFTSMGALATHSGIRKLDELADNAPIDYRTISRPFCPSAGFTMGESCITSILMDDALAMETGADILGAVLGVHCRADGYKKSVSAPGAGNYLSLFHSCHDIRNLLGDTWLQRSFVLAHGTSTPMNRITESHALSLLADRMGIPDWLVVAPKAHLGHSMASSAADQLMVALGAWQQGWLPGIRHCEQLAEDIDQDNLDILLQDRHIDPEQLGPAILNARGFGGNNASAAIISSALTRQLLQRRYSSTDWSNHQRVGETVSERQRDYQQAALRGDYRTRYRFDHNVLNPMEHPEDMQLTRDELHYRDLPSVASNTATSWPDLVQD